jgi:catechol 2,3-dioxygenase-like lactoylglutathione lyase family enzyme
VTPQARIDHLVFAARSLDEGVAWCREHLGVQPAGGGEHVLMGTHNRVFRVDSAGFERAYFEIIAINPAAAAPGRPRWFDLDDEGMRAALAKSPKLVHFVASTNQIESAVAALAAQDIDRGAVIAVERGSLRWKMTVRPDGQRLFDGALPTLIQWEGAHPCDSLPASGATLRSLTVTHPQSDALRKAYEAIGLGHVVVRDGAACVQAVIATPFGPVTVDSKGT